MKNARVGFTLVELLMVIAVIGIISTLAIQKLSGIKVDSSEKINVANLQRISSALETHVAVNAEKPKFDKLDALVLSGVSDGTGGATSDLQDTSKLMVYEDNELNRGLASELVGSGQNQYAGSSAPILGTYYLSESEVEVLKRDLGIRYLMRGYPTHPSGSLYGLEGEDGAYVSGSTNVADTCASVATSNATGRAVAAVNPGATQGRSPVGPSIYKACGMDVAYTLQGQVMVNGVKYTTNEDAFKALRNAGDEGGILLAFGLGESCSLVGNNVAGLDSAPISPVMLKDEYRRYLVLVRLVYTPNTRGVPAAKRAEYVGVMDPRGRTTSMLR